MLQNGSIQLNIARLPDSLTCQSCHQQIMEPPSVDWKYDRLAPYWASTFHYLTPRPPAGHQCLERPNPEHNSTAAAAFPLPQEFGSLYSQTVRNHLQVSQVPTLRPNIALPLNAKHHQARSAWCRIRQRWALAQRSSVCSQTSRDLFSIFMVGGKGFGIELGSVTSLQQ